MSLEFLNAGEDRLAAAHPVLRHPQAARLTGHHKATAELLPNGMWHLKAETPTVEAHVSVPHTHYDTSPMHLEYLRARPTGQGNGPMAFARIVAAAREHGYKKIEMHAMRAKTMNGYYTWPLLGAEGPLHAHSSLFDDAKGRHAKLREEHPDVRTIQDLLAKPGGAEWWKEHGWSVPLTFHTDKTEALMHYLTKRRGS